MKEQRTEVVEYCRRLAASGLSCGTSGNISLLDRDSGHVAISPSSMDYGDITAADVVLLDLAGRLVDGQRRPSSEWGMHLAAYRARADINAVVHTHSPAATTLAVLGWELPAVHYMIALGGSACVPVVPYHTFGTAALADAVGAGLARCRACLLQNHGVLAGGSDLPAAFSLAEHLEFCADLYLRARSVGEPRILDEKQIAEVIDRLQDYRPQR